MTGNKQQGHDLQKQVIMQFEEGVLIVANIFACNNLCLLHLAKIAAQTQKYLQGYLRSKIPPCLLFKCVSFVGVDIHVDTDTPHLTLMSLCSPVSSKNVMLFPSRVYVLYFMTFIKKVHLI